MDAGGRATQGAVAESNAWTMLGRASVESRQDAYRDVGVRATQEPKPNEDRAIADELETIVAIMVLDG